MSTPKPAKVLIVDDEANARDALGELLKAEGYITATARDGHEALRKLDSFEPDVVLTDLKMPRVDGMELLRRGTAAAPHACFVVMTAFGSIENAVLAMRQGAENYVTKPLDLDALVLTVQRAAEKSQLRREATRLRYEISDRYSFEKIVGDHPSMQRLLKQVAQVARSRATILIQGESGTGKELVAAAIHHNSRRARAPFVRLNCAALAESLLESELFGHEKGAFTGAGTRREGRFEQANGGTLFLDEVSEIPTNVQVKLLRFLQERNFERVGGNETVEVDVRVVAASNRDLAAMVERREFREDLYYRLNVVCLDIPPLRDRRSDVPALAHHFLRKHAEANESEVAGFKDGALRQLVTYSWPGNVRELENAVERAVVMTNGQWVEALDLPAGGDMPASGDDPSAFVAAGLTMAEIERRVIEQSLEMCGGSTALAAKRLGISRRKIQYRLKEWSTEPEGPSGASTNALEVTG